MRRALIAAIAVLATIGAASADLLLMGVGGGGTGSAPTGCTNQLVLDYSNSCALIGQGFGQ